MQNATFDEIPHENERIRVISGCAISSFARAKHGCTGGWLILWLHFCCIKSLVYIVYFSMMMTFHVSPFRITAIAERQLCAATMVSPLKLTIFNVNLCMLQIKFMSTFEIAIRWMSLNPFHKSTIVKSMAWCHQVTSHYLSHCWPTSMSSYGITRPQWVNTLRPRQDGRYFADNVLKCIFLSKMCEFRLRFHWSLFLRVQLTIFQH